MRLKPFEVILYLFELRQYPQVGWQSPHTLETHKPILGGILPQNKLKQYTKESNRCADALALNVIHIERHSNDGFYQVRHLPVRALAKPYLIAFTIE
jgi:hypothetical protein